MDTPRAVTYRGTFHQWFMSGVFANLILPTTWVHSWTVSRVSCQSDTQSSGHTGDSRSSFTTGTLSAVGNALPWCRGLSRVRPSRTDPSGPGGASGCCAGDLKHARAQFLVTGAFSGPKPGAAEALRWWRVVLEHPATVCAFDRRMAKGEGPNMTSSLKVTALSVATAVALAISMIGAPSAIAVASSRASGTARLTVTVPGVPRGLSGIAENGRVDLAWSAPLSDGGASIAGYIVFPYIGSTPLSGRTFNSPDTAQLIDGLTNGVTYTFRVAAWNAVGFGPISGFSSGFTPRSTTREQAYVTAAYVDLLGRAPTSSRLAYWSAYLHGGGSRAAFIANLTGSPEHVSHLIIQLYNNILGRAPTASSLASWQQLVSSKRLTIARVAVTFYASDEYYSHAGGGTIATWVTSLYHSVLNRVPPASSVSYWSALASSKGRAYVAGQLYQSGEARGDRVDHLYQQLLHRLPAADVRASWEAMILTAGDDALVLHLAVSDEYVSLAQSRFP